MISIGTPFSAFRPYRSPSKDEKKDNEDLPAKKPKLSTEMDLSQLSQLTQLGLNLLPQPGQPSLPLVDPLAALTPQLAKQLLGFDPSQLIATSLPSLPITSLASLPSIPISSPSTSSDIHIVATSAPKAEEQGQEGRRRKRTTFTTQQAMQLEKEYLSDQYMPRNRRLTVAEELGLSECQIKTWFQNRRAKDKKIRPDRTEASSSSPVASVPPMPAVSLPPPLPSSLPPTLPPSLYPGFNYASQYGYDLGGMSAEALASYLDSVNKDKDEAEPPTI